MKSGLYTVKSEYQVERNVLNREPDIVYLESIIIKLQVFTRKINAPQKMHHLIWQTATHYKKTEV